MIKRWEDLIILCLGICRELIYKKNQKYLKSQHKFEDNLTELDKNIIKIKFEYSLNIYTCINYRLYRNKVKKVFKSVIKHKLAAFIELFSYKIEKDEIALKFMEMMMATPFDDDILCLKMCV